MSKQPKLYAERDVEALDKMGGYYMRHVMAMTAESLHSKSAIAAELAWRDKRIAELEALQSEPAQPLPAAPQQEQK